MKILLATHNASKLERYKKILGVIDFIELISLKDLGITKKVDEDYETNVENALHKAREYGKISGFITVAIDEAVMTNFLPDNEQPGIYARRFSKNKNELTDEEVVEAWREIFEIYPQDDKQFIWNFAVAYFNPKNNCKEVRCVENILYRAKYFSSCKSNGYPMSIFLSPVKNGIPNIEIAEKEKDKKDREVFASFADNFSKWALRQRIDD